MKEGAESYFLLSGRDPFPSHISRRGGRQSPTTELLSLSMPSTRSTEELMASASKKNHNSSNNQSPDCRSPSKKLLPCLSVEVGTRLVR